MEYKHTHIAQEEWAKPAVGGDGYDFMDTGRAAGWHWIAGWGAKGWHAGEWPYVIYGWRLHDRGFQAVEYCEGDLTIATAPTKADVIDQLNEWIIGGWRARPDHSPATKDPDWKPEREVPAKFLGPFSWHRTCDPEKNKLNCQSCQGIVANFKNYGIRVAYWEGGVYAMQTVDEGSSPRYEISLVGAATLRDLDQALIPLLASYHPYWHAE